ncbi:TPA: hypothetical protein ACY4QE_004927, partial [Vibrio parahaemolyticus]
MRVFFILLVMMLNGCASYEPDQYGNYNDVTLTPNEMHAISQDIASFLRQSDGARTIINLNNDGSTFAKTLIEELRLEGIGVAQGNEMDYLSLNYRVEQLNPRQFFVS